MFVTTETSKIPVNYMSIILIIHNYFFILRIEIYFMPIDLIDLKKYTENGRTAGSKSIHLVFLVITKRRINAKNKN